MKYQKRKFLCWLLGHKLKWTGRVANYADNISEVICDRCGGKCKTFLPYKYLWKREKLYTDEYYKYEKFIKRN